MTNENLKKKLPYFIFFLLTVLFFHNFIFQNKFFLPSDITVSEYPWKSYQESNGVHNPYLSDVIDQYMPNNIIFADALKKGMLPLWNPYSLGGIPFLANPTMAAAYPVKCILYFLFSPPVAHGINIMLHVFFMGITMYLFASTLGMSRFSAFFSGTHSTPPFGTSRLNSNCI